MKKIQTAIGLMSGTSIDGIDIALIKSDGENVIDRQLFTYYPYKKQLKEEVKALINDNSTPLLKIKEIESEITNQHIIAVQDFLNVNEIERDQIDVIGFHGHTILHHPEKMISWQIGNAQLLASALEIDVVGDFRNKDIIFGGQGAPLVPIYHHHLFHGTKKPSLIVNIGGVSNLTYIDNENVNNLIAFDNCFGNGPSDDLINTKLNKNFDENGSLAKSGKVNLDLSQELLQNEYFLRTPPKSLDRNHFQKTLFKINQLPIADALATFSYIIGKSIESALKFLPSKPQQIIVCGGGRKNTAIMDNIREINQIETLDVDQLNTDQKKIDGDAIEAEAFAFLAIRHLKNLPISFRKTTGVLPEKHIAQISSKQRLSSCGGVFYRA